ncbi:tail fiber assembly protein [Enterobacter roggenkampii]|uniref:Tail fiber protein n=1 Tax=Enterobacter roggenkampii TaxID=1812935 RepID=A0AAU9BTZ9_9ENTR|nr:tail fiber assembly protein [Enterobacter roggenkampii]BCL44061.1 tail fiber protein [Enterobacter roggenkampii]
MTIYYSPATGGLYPDGEKYNSLPPDAVEITAELYSELINGQSAGKNITQNGSGLPYLSDPVIDHVADAAVMRSGLRAVADAEIAPLQDAVDLGIATDAETAALTEWKKYRVLLNRVDTSAAPEIEWPTQPGERAS